VKRPGPGRKLLAGSLGITLLVAALGYVALISPRRSESTKLASQIEDVKNTILLRRIALRPTRLQAIKAADLFPLARAMPVTTDMPDLLIQLSQIASETGITFKSITPGPPTSYGLYTQQPIDLDFQGRFYDLADFLYRLRNLVEVHDGVLKVGGRLFSVDGISFGAGDPAFPQIDASLTVDAYTYDGSDVVGAPAPPSLPAGASAAGSGVNG
jgi:hypothetical protein